MSKLPEWKDLPDWLKGIVLLFGLLAAGTSVYAPNLLKSTKEEPPKEVPTPTTPNPESQKVELGIYVKNDKDNNPIEDAKVRLEPPNSPPETKKTNGDGYTTFTIPKGVNIQVIITKEKFRKKETTYNDTIDPTKNKTYYLIPETDISSVKPSSSPLLITGTSPPASTSKPYISPIKPSPIPSSVTKTSPLENSNNLELALLDTLTIYVSFLKDGHNIKLANGIKNQLKGIGVKSNIVLKSGTIEELRKMATVTPVGFEIRVDYDEISAGYLLVNKLKDFYPNLVFKLIHKNSPPDLYTKNYMSIFLDTFPDEYEERLSPEPLN